MNSSNTRSTVEPLASRRTGSLRFLSGGLIGLSAVMAMPLAAAQEFTPIQADLFGAEPASSSAWADYDGDGHLDLAVASARGVRLYRNDQGLFADVTRQVGLAPRNADKDHVLVALAWGDYDRDGDLDLYAGTLLPHGTRLTHLTRNYLYRNDGVRGFAEVAAQLGVDLPGADTRQVSWIDADRDGDLDLFLAQRSGYNRLFRNDSGMFTDISGEAGLFDPRRTVGACWFDMDQDGDLDVFLANQNGDKDALYRNEGGKFTDIAPERRMDQPHRSLAEGGVGCTVGDFDNDGDLDLFVATYGASLLYRNDGKGHFEEVASQQGMAESSHAVGASWGDYDLDGSLDLYVTGYHASKEGLRLQARLFHNEGGRFVNRVTQTSSLNVADHGVQWADYDQDGDLDLTLTSTFKLTPAELSVLRNELPKDRKRTSLQILILDAQGHYTCAGAEVRLYDRQNKLLGTRIVPTGDGYNSQSATPVHFGIPEGEGVTVEVTFLTAAGRQMQRLSGIEPKAWTGKVLTIKQEPLKR